MPDYARFAVPGFLRINEIFTVTPLLAYCYFGRGGVRIHRRGTDSGKYRRIDSVVLMISRHFFNSTDTDNPFAVFMFAGLKHDKVADHIQQCYRIKQPL